MQIEHTLIEGVKVITPKVFGDERGYFTETYNHARMTAAEITTTFVQDNEAMSHRGVLRGLHYQMAPYAQYKLVRVIAGAVFDVAVDIRPNSPTYGQWYGCVLSGENKRQLLVPGYCAHGYLAMTDNTILAYKCSNEYTPDAEGGIHPLDPKIGIEWPQIDVPMRLSERDQGLAKFGDHPWV